MALPNEMTVKPSSPSGPGAPGKKSSGGSWIGFVVVCLLIGGGVWWWMRMHDTSGEKKGPGMGRGELPPVPVVAGVVAEKDVPIYLDGLGAVQAYNTVTMRPRVDGQVTKVAFEEGQDVRVGDVLAQIDPDPFRAVLEQTIAKKGQDEAQLGNAKVDLKRYADLLASEGVTQQVYDTQKALVNQLEATVKADQAAIESAKVQLAYTTITSPIDGRTGIRQVDVGNIVHASDATGLVVITQLKPISVVFTLQAYHLGKIQAEAALGDIQVLALQSDNTTVLGEGKLAVIDNQIDTTTSTIKIKATFPNTDLHLWPGQFVNARLLLTIRKNSAVVPASVVQRGPEGPLSAFAFVINEDQTVDIRPVKVAQIEEGEALISDGLKPGERVVVDGQFKLQKGSKIKIADPAGAGSEVQRGDRSTNQPGAEGQRGGRPPKQAGATNVNGARGPRKAKP